MVVVTQDEYFHKYDMISNIKKDGIILINTSKNEEEINSLIRDEDKKIIKEKNIKVYYIDASKIASENNIKGKINKILELIGKILFYANHGRHLNLFTRRYISIKTELAIAIAE